MANKEQRKLYEEKRLAQEAFKAQVQDFKDRINTLELEARYSKALWEKRYYALESKKLEAEYKQLEAEERALRQAQIDAQIAENNKAMEELKAMSEVSEAQLSPENESESIPESV